jgi:hypothetical protein
VISTKPFCRSTPVCAGAGDEGFASFAPYQKVIHIFSTTGDTVNPRTSRKGSGGIMLARGNRAVAGEQIEANNRKMPKQKTKETRS